MERFAEAAARHVGPDQIPGLVALVSRPGITCMSRLSAPCLLAGLVSTAEDLLAFARMFLSAGAPALSKEAVAQMTRDQLTPTQRAGGADAFLHGRSWSLCQSVITQGPRAGAFGWDGGLGTSWLVDPARALVVIVLTQRLWETPQAPAVHVELQDAAYAALT